MQHHAILLVGEEVDVPSRGIDTEYLYSEQFEIEDARALRARASLRPLKEEKRLFVLSCQNLTHAAQNALLKLFEDPPGTAQFILIVPSREILLPTLRSRLHDRSVGSSKNYETSKAQSFLEKTPKERLSIITEGLKDKEHARIWACEVVLGIGKLLNKTKHSLAVYREVTHSVTYITRSGSSPKMILEHLALILPKF